MHVCMMEQAMDKAHLDLSPGATGDWRVPRTRATHRKQQQCSEVLLQGSVHEFLSMEKQQDHAMGLAFWVTQPQKSQQSKVGPYSWNGDHMAD